MWNLYNMPITQTENSSGVHWGDGRSRSKGTRPGGMSVTAEAEDVSNRSRGAPNVLTQVRLCMGLPDPLDLFAGCEHVNM